MTGRYSAAEDEAIIDAGECFKRAIDRRRIIRSGVTVDCFLNDLGTAVGHQELGAAGVEAAGRLPDRIRLITCREHRVDTVPDAERDGHQTLVPALVIWQGLGV